MSTSDGRRYMARVAALGCVLCRRMGYHDTPAEVHHARTGAGAGRKAADTDTIPLCAIHHRTSNEALHVMGRRAFERHHGVTELELLADTKRLLGIEE